MNLENKTEFDVLVDIVADLIDRNHPTLAYRTVADYYSAYRLSRIFFKIEELHLIEGYMTESLARYRGSTLESLYTLLDDVVAPSQRERLYNLI